MNEPKTENRTEAINIRVEPALKWAIKEAAVQEKRSVSNLVIKVLSDFVEQKRGE